MSFPSFSCSLTHSLYLPFSLFISGLQYIWFLGCTVLSLALASIRSLDEKLLNSILRALVGTDIQSFTYGALMQRGYGSNAKQMRIRNNGFYLGSPLPSLSLILPAALLEAQLLCPTFPLLLLLLFGLVKLLLFMG